MRTLLRIDASVRRGHSYSRQLTDYFEECWREACPDGRIIRRDLAAAAPPHLDEETLEVFYAGGEASPGNAPVGLRWSDELIAEIRAADDIVVGSAVYNFGMPSSLKAWIDHVVRFGHTITLADQRVAGLMQGKSVCVLTARGGFPSFSPEFLTDGLRAFFRYIGVESIQVVALEGTRMSDAALQERVEKARKEIAGLFSIH